MIHANDTRSAAIATLARLAIFVLSVVACQERLAAPADCPALCPGGYEVRDTVLDPLPAQDSSYEGYVLAGQGSSLRVSYQFPASEDRVVYRFVARPDSFLVTNDSVVPYTLDSVALTLTVAYRDTAVKNLQVFLYRLPATLDSGFTFADAEAAFQPANIIDSLLVDDTLVTQSLVTILKDATLARVAIDPADSGVLAMGVQIRADQGTGVRISNANTALPNFVSHVTIPLTDSTTATRQIVRAPAFATFVSQSIPPLDQSLLTVGGAPSARTLIRFPWPANLKDSAQLVRATLELVPTAAIPGLHGDTALISARAILADFGSKSPATNDGFVIATEPLVEGQTDTVRFEVRRALVSWQGSNPTPPAFIIQLFPEASSFTRATFGSTRTPGFEPRLRITYAATFPFEEP
jgi:hypothetical protein